MVTYSIIQKSQLEGAYRLDAEYYQPEYLENEKLLAKIGFRLIGDIGSVVYGTTPPGASFVEKGIPFIRSQNFSNLTVDDLDIVYASEEFHSRNKKSAARPGDILFAAVGATIGELAIIQKSISEANINQNIAKVRINKEFNLYFVGIFFASRIGQLQISRLVTGNAQAYLNSLQIREFKVPKFPLNKQEEVTSYFMEIERTLEQSKSFYSQAEDLLLEELGLNDFKVEEDLSYIANLSDVKSSHRIDAEYFQPRYQIIENKLIKSFKAKKIKNLDFINITTGQYCDEYTTISNGKPYIRGTDLAMGTVKLDDLVYIEPTKQIPSKKAKEGDVVVTRVGTIGIAARLSKEIEGGTISDNLIRLRFDEEDLNSFYVSLFFNTIGSQLMIRESRGSVQARLNQETLKEIVLPILSTSTQQKIADLVRKSHEARKKAKELLEEAKQEVEDLIEKG